MSQNSSKRSTKSFQNYKRSCKLLQAKGVKEPDENCWYQCISKGSTLYRKLTTHKSRLRIKDLKTYEQCMCINARKLHKEVDRATFTSIYPLANFTEEQSHKVNQLCDRLRGFDLAPFIDQLPALPIHGNWMQLNINALCYHERVFSLLSLGGNTRLVEAYNPQSLQWCWDVLFWLVGTIFELRHEGGTITIGLPNWYECTYHHSHNDYRYSDLSRCCFMIIAMCQYRYFERKFLGYEDPRLVIPDDGPCDIPEV